MALGNWVNSGLGLYPKVPGLKNIVGKSKGETALSEKVEHVEVFATITELPGIIAERQEKVELSGNPLTQDKAQRSMEKSVTAFHLKFTLCINI